MSIRADRFYLIGTKFPDKKKTPVPLLCWDRCDILRCHPAWSVSNPLTAYLHTPVFDHGGPSPSHLLRFLPFSSPSEAHSTGSVYRFAAPAALLKLSRHTTLRHRFKEIISVCRGYVKVKPCPDTIVNNRAPVIIPIISFSG